MKELINEDNNMKMMALVMCGLSYGDSKYLLYSVKRSNDEANLFVSKLVKNSSGYTISHDFSNGEKEVLDGVVQRIISKEDVSLLEKDGYHILKGIELGDINYFDVDSCYVATVSVKLVKDCLIFYDLVSDEFLNRPVIDVVDDKKIFNQGFALNVVVIVIGIFIVLFCVSIVMGFLFK